MHPYMRSENFLLSVDFPILDLKQWRQMVIKVLERIWGIFLGIGNSEPIVCQRRSMRCYHRWKWVINRPLLPFLKEEKNISIGTQHRNQKFINYTKLDQVNSANFLFQLWSVDMVAMDIMIYDSTGSLQGSTGWYLMVLGQYRAILVVTWWYWVSIT